MRASIKRNIICVFWRMIDFLEDLWFNTKWLLQRLFRGWSDKDLWNLDYTISEFIIPRLEAFKRGTYGYPAEFKTAGEWEKVIDKMIWSFDYIVNQDKYEDGLMEKYKDNQFDEQGHYRWIKDAKELSEKCQEGLDLFGTYFRSLWW